MTSTLEKTYAKALAEAREAAGLTQEEAYDYLSENGVKMSLRSYQGYERGEYEPKNEKKRSQILDLLVVAGKSRGVSPEPGGPMSPFSSSPFNANVEIPIFNAGESLENTGRTSPQSYVRLLMHIPTEDAWERLRVIEIGKGHYLARMFRQPRSLLELVRGGYLVDYPYLLRANGIYMVRRMRLEAASGQVRIDEMPDESRSEYVLPQQADIEVYAYVFAFLGNDAPDP